MTKFKLNFDKICDACHKKIRWYHKLDFTFVDADTNRLVRKNTPMEILEKKNIIINIFHRKCLRRLVDQAAFTLTEIMKQRKNISDEDLR